MALWLSPAILFMDKDWARLTRISGSCAIARLWRFLCWDSYDLNQTRQFPSWLLWRREMLTLLMMRWLNLHTSAGVKRLLCRQPKSPTYAPPMPFGDTNTLTQAIVSMTLLWLACQDAARTKEYGIHDPASGKTIKCCGTEACINRIIWVGTEVLWHRLCGMVDAADSKSASGDRVVKSLQPYQQDLDKRCH